jgi:hypothetical protein
MEVQMEADDKFKEAGNVLLEIANIGINCSKCGLDHWTVSVNASGARPDK